MTSPCTNRPTQLLASSLVIAATLASAPAPAGPAPDPSTPQEAAVPAAAAAMTESQQEAARLLRGMAEYLAGLETFSVSMRTGYDVLQPSGQKIEFGEARSLIVARPDRLRLEEISSDGSSDLLIFDGKTLSVLNGDRGVYAQAPQPGGIDDSLVYFVRDLRMRMPLAQLFTTRLPAELPSRVKALDYVESTEAWGVPTHHIAGRTDNVDFQFWLTASEHPLPVRVVITYVHAPGAPQFWANFIDWSTSPKFGETTFRFTPPAGAQKIPFAVQVRHAPPSAANPRQEGRP